MKTVFVSVMAVAAMAMSGATGAQAKECVTKSAVATAGTADQAKWFALETTVQAVSWGLWPGFVATSKVDGYHVSDRYTCKPDGGQVSCNVTATFCKK